MVLPSERRYVTQSSRWKRISGYRHSRRTIVSFTWYIYRLRDVIVICAWVGNTPHNPVRFADTVGIVIERTRPEGSLDRLRWYCDNEACRAIVFEESFHCTDLGKTIIETLVVTLIFYVGVQLKPVIEKYYAHESLRTCRHCNNINSVPS